VIRESGALERSLVVAARYVEDAKNELRCVPAGESRDMMEALAIESLSRTR
jgi:geranylgeranyl pyrophosphate synthase